MLSFFTRRRRAPMSPFVDKRKRDRTTIFLVSFFCVQLDDRSLNGRDDTLISKRSWLLCGDMRVAIVTFVKMAETTRAVTWRGWIRGVRAVRRETSYASTPTFNICNLAARPLPQLHSDHIPSLLSVFPAFPQRLLKKYEREV